VVGEGTRSQFSGKYVVKKYDLNTQIDSSIFIDNYVRDYNNNKIDINRNKYVAVVWENFIAIGDFSGDVIAPTISITTNEKQVTKDETISLMWQANDNKDELFRFEIFKNYNTTPIATITDISTLSYEDIVTQTDGTLTYTIKAYDYDGNITLWKILCQTIFKLT